MLVAGFKMKCWLGISRSGRPLGGEALADILVRHCFPLKHALIVRKSAKIASAVIQANPAAWGAQGQIPGKL